MLSGAAAFDAHAGLIVDLVLTFAMCGGFVTIPVDYLNNSACRVIAQERVKLVSGKAPTAIIVVIDRVWSAAANVSVAACTGWNRRGLALIWGHAAPSNVSGKCKCGVFSPMS